MSGELEPGEEDRYALELDSFEAVVLQVDQKSVDVRVQIVDPTGDGGFDFDSPVGREESERVCFVANQTGAFTITISPFSGGGEYQLHWLRKRRATEDDLACESGARAFMAAERARSRPPSDRAQGFERAASFFRQAREPMLEALAKREAASHWIALGNNLEGIESFERSLAMARLAQSTYLELSVLNRLGLAHLDSGDFESAVAAFSEARERARNSENRRAEASALSNLGLAREGTGDTYEAIEYYRKALPILREIGAHPDLAQTLRNLANAYGILGYHDEALDLLDEALTLALEHQDEERRAVALSTRAWIYLLAGEPSRGLDPLRQALALRRRQGNRNAEAALLDWQGSLLRKLGQYSAALESYEQSIAISRTNESPLDIAATTLNLGCLMEDMDRLDEAQVQLSEARQLYQELDDPKAQAHIGFCSARTARKGGDLEAALDSIRGAMEIVENLRGRARSLGAEPRPVGLWQDYSELEVRILLELYERTGEKRFAARAFEATDLARARSLAESIPPARQAALERAAPDLVEKEYSEQQRLNRLERLRHRQKISEAQPREILATERQIRRGGLELERIRAKIRATDPSALDLHNGSAITLAETQRQLEPGTLLLVYSLGFEESALFCIRSDALEVFPLAPRESLEAHANALYQALKQSRFDPTQWSVTAESLRALLLPQGSLQPLDQRLLVITEGLLLYVPLSILPIPQPPGASASDEVLVDAFETVYLPSASVWSALRQRHQERPTAQRAVAIFADPVLSTHDSRLDPSSADSARLSETPPSTLEPLLASRRPLPRLYYSAQEAQAILDLASPETSFSALGFDATKQQVLSTDLRPYRYLHFATHAWAEERLPALSSLVFSRYTPDGSPVDGSLFLHEVFSLRLAADLTVLSGCQTALGPRVRGDGLLGLTRGFLQAGSSQVLVSLWNVDDKATAVLMSEFYRGLLKRGESPATALANAQRWMRRQPGWESPFYWAPFVLQGAS